MEQFDIVLTRYFMQLISFPKAFSIPSISPSKGCFIQMKLYDDKAKFMLDGNQTLQNS